MNRHHLTFSRDARDTYISTHYCIICILSFISLFIFSFIVKICLNYDCYVYFN